MYCWRGLGCRFAYNGRDMLYHFWWTEQSEYWEERGRFCWCFLNNNHTYQLNSVFTGYCSSSTFPCLWPFCNTCIHAEGYLILWAIHKYFLNIHQWQIWSWLSSCVRNCLDWCLFFHFWLSDEYGPWLLDRYCSLASDLPKWCPSAPAIATETSKGGSTHWLRSHSLQAKESERAADSEHYSKIVTRLSDVSLLTRFTGISNTVMGVCESPL